jgi:hypothetical protein
LSLSSLRSQNRHKKGQGNGWAFGGEEMKVIKPEKTQLGWLFCVAMPNETIMIVTFNEGEIPGLYFFDQLILSKSAVEILLPTLKEWGEGKK